MTERKAASRDSDIKAIPMGELKSLLSFSREFTPEDYERLSLGLIPMGMDEKWFIFLEDDWLYFHRSWTGACIYQVALERKGNDYVVAEAWVQRDPDKYKGKDVDYDAAVLSFLIDNFLLGKQTPFPLPNDLPNDFPKGAYQHSVSGSGYPEIPFDKSS
jgi:hypothetical protein